MVVQGPLRVLVILPCLLASTCPPSTVFHSLPSSLLCWPQLWLPQLSFSIPFPHCLMGLYSALDPA